MKVPKNKVSLFFLNLIEIGGGSKDLFAVESPCNNLNKTISKQPFETN